MILEIGGKKVTKESPLQKLVRKCAPGDEIVVKIWRNGEILEKKVTLQSSKDIE